jgi:sugar O-acyltransferase (sialic acid O-acetyltransferase NeuD family)
MTGKPLILFGGDPELVEVAKFYFETDSDCEVAAVTMDSAYIKESSLLGLPVVPFEKIEKSHPASAYDMFVALSYSKVNANRRAKCEEALAKGYALTSYVSSRATTFATLSNGFNCFILEDNTIQPFAKIGNGVTLWSGNHIGHHSVIGDYCFVTSHVVVSGAVQVGEQTFLGVNATINDSVKIGRECVIGSGSLIAKDVADYSVLSAQPAELSRVPSNRLRGF